MQIHVILSAEPSMRHLKFFEVYFGTHPFKLPLPQSFRHTMRSFPHSCYIPQALWFYFCLLRSSFSGLSEQDTSLSNRTKSGEIVVAIGQN
jgi:hypothetical protein